MREHGQRSQEQLRILLCRCGHFTQSRIPTPANQTTTHPPSPPPPCAARVVEDKPSFPPPPPRKPANTPLQLTSTPRETRVRTIASIISDKDVTEPTTTPTLPLLKCVVDVVVFRYAVQTQITISSTQQETRAPPTSLQMTATDNSTRRLSQLKSFAVLVVGAFNGLPIRFRNLQRHLYAPTPLQTTTMRRVLSTPKTHQHVECTCVILISRPHHQLSHFSINSNETDTTLQCSTLQSNVVHVVEVSNNLLVDANVSNSEGYTCSDIAVFRSYGYEDLCTSAYDTPAICSLGNVSCLWWWTIDGRFMV